MEFTQSFTQWKSLGEPIKVVTVHSAVFAQTPHGFSLFVVQRGLPALLTQFVLPRYHPVAAIPLPQAEGAENILFTSAGDLWVPTLPHGRLYRFSPGTSSLVSIPLPTSDPCFLWDAAETDLGAVFIGSWPEARLIKCDYDNNFIDLGPVAPPEDYIRSLAYSRLTRKLYLGIGAHARLLEFDPSTQERRDILPAKFSTQQFVMRLATAGPWLLAQLAPAPTTLVLNLEGELRLIGEIAAWDCRDVLQHSERPHVFILCAAEKLVALQAPTLDVQSLADVGPGLRALSWDRNKPSESPILALNARGELLRIKETTGDVSTIPVELPPQPLVLHNVACGPDGRIYTSGYVSGGVGIYDPLTERREFFSGIGQAESITHDGKHIYFGVYPRAIIVRYNPTAPRDGNNPRELLRLTPCQQDRPYAMAVHAGSGKLFVGTVPAYGHLGGALAVYEPATQETRVYRHLIPEQSIVSLLVVGNTVWGGSSISGGLGIAPAAESAELFAFDCTNERLVVRVTPVPKARGITGLVRDSHGILYGWAEGTLFAFCPEKNRVLWQKTVFSETFPADHYWRGIVMKPSLYEQDVYYGAAWGTIFRFAALTEQLTILAKIPDAEVVAPGADGNLYAISGAELFQIETK